MDTIDRDILYSILDKDPKRAAAYWFISMNVTDEPDTRRYSVETYGTDYIFRVRLDLGFKCHQRVNVYLRQIVRDLIESGELPPQERKYSIYGKSDVGSFKFVFSTRPCRPSRSFPSLTSWCSTRSMPSGALPAPRCAGTGWTRPRSSWRPCRSSSAAKRRAAAGWKE